MKKKNILLLQILFYFACSFAQENGNTLSLYQDTLQTLQHAIYKGKTDGDKYKANRTFLHIFERALNTENSFNFNFDSLNAIARLTSPDRTFKIYNWNIPKTDGTFEYFGFVQTFNKKKKKSSIYQLTDRSDEVRNAGNYSSNNNKWYGMLYYKIILKKYKRKKYYTLLAWDGNDRISSKKFIDVLTFTPEGAPQFGEAIFEMGKKIPKRIVFEHNAEITMSLKYDEKKDLIIFDHLTPSNPGLEGHAEFYGPDFSYDAFQFKKGKWVYIEDVDARNKKNANDALYKNPETQTIPK